MAIGDPFLLGVNYWPRRNAMYWWARFDPEEVKEEFSVIASLGLTHVRLFLLWESFQPTSGGVDERAIDNVRTVCDIAQASGLRLQPNFFTGHMSGPNWAPDWLLSDRPRKVGERQVVSLARHSASPFAIHNVYTTQFVIDAERLLLQTICSWLADHPAIWAWSLGNEPDLFCQPPNALIGHQWMRDRVADIRAVDPHHPVMIGLCGNSWYADVGLRVDHAADATDISEMHGYSIYDPELARRPLDPDYVPFVCALTNALAGRPVLFEEFGLCNREVDGPSGYENQTSWDGTVQRQFYSSEADGARYFSEVLPRLQRVGALGAFAWCFSDYDKSLWNLPPCDFVKHERFFGLVRADGSLKPAAEAFRAFAATRPKVLAPERVVTLPVGMDTYYQDSRRYHRALYERFGTL